MAFRAVGCWAGFTTASVNVYPPCHLQGVTARPVGGCGVCVYGVVCSIVSCLLEYVAVDCVGRSMVGICLCFNEFAEASVKVGEFMFGVVYCVLVLCVGPRS